MPKISVCIASYNGEKYIEEQLKSILSQIKENDEIIISDDFSTDTTTFIIESLNDTRIHLFKNSVKFKNHNFNFENTLKKASGEIIFMADQDDVWAPNKVRRFLEIFEITNADLVISDCFLVNSKKDIIVDSFFKIRNSQSGFFKNFYKNSYVGCCMAFNRTILEASLPFPKYVFSHDTWIGLIGEMIGKTYFLREPLIYFRRHGENFSAHSLGDAFLTNKSSYSLLGSILLRFTLLKMLILRFLKLKAKCLKIKFF